MSTSELPASQIDEVSEQTKAQKTAPRRSKRYRLFDDGQGDYRWYRLVTEETGPAPRGSLLIQPHIPGFLTAADAMKWLRNNGDSCAGSQLMLMRGLELIFVQVQQRAAVVLDRKPRTQVAGPTEG